MSIVDDKVILFSTRLCKHNIFVIDNNTNYLGVISHSLISPESQNFNYFSFNLILILIAYFYRILSYTCEWIIYSSNTCEDRYMGCANII